jgi:hypothetical protein
VIRRTSALGQLAPTAIEVELLRAATLPVPEALGAWRRWREVTQLVDASARCRSLLPAVAANLANEDLGDDAEPLRLVRRRTWADNQLRFSAAGHLIEVLGPSGSQVVVAKGAALALTAYPHVGDREMGDIDVVVGPDAFGPAADLLFANGWRPGDDFEHQPFMHACAILDDAGREIDLHKWMMFPRMSRWPERWHERSLPFEIGGQSCRRYAPSDELVLAITHGLAPRANSMLRWPVDVATLVEFIERTSEREGRAELEAFWTEVVESADELAVGARVAAGLAFCARECGVDVPSDVVRQLLSSRSDRGLAREWWLTRSGLPRPFRSRQYIDPERASGRTPTASGYMEMRLQAYRKGGGPAAIVRRRFARIGRHTRRDGSTGSSA